MSKKIDIIFFSLLHTTFFSALVYGFINNLVGFESVLIMLCIMCATYVSIRGDKECDLN